MKKTLFVSALLLAACNTSQSTITVPMYSTDSSSYIGKVIFSDTSKGLRIQTDLTNLPFGEHGFHVHEYPNCNTGINKNHQIELALAAGGHYDPEKTGKHLGPNGDGHKGDLPRLIVSTNGKTQQVFYLTGIKTTDFANKSLMIHAGGDNYKDTPLPLGGGGKRIACGIIEK